MLHRQQSVTSIAVKKTARILLGLSLVLIAFNLRPVFSSFSALLPEIVATTGMSTFTAGLLTTLPVLCLGVFAPLAPRLAQQIGVEKTLFLVMFFLFIATLMRGLGTLPFLFMGSALAGACIAVGNVLLPGVVKRDFPDQAAIMTGLYTMALCGGAAAAAGMTVPVKNLLNGSWQWALAFWGLPALLVLLIWLPQSFRNNHHSRGSHIRVTGLWRDKLAWQVTFFMGLQSALAYIVFGWMSPILRERGLSGEAAGLIVSISIMAQVVACLLIPSLAMRFKTQSLLNVLLYVCAVAGLLGLLYAPLSGAWGWAVIQGIGQGGLIAAAMIMIVLRSKDALIAAHLSGMAQCVGYSMAAFGPLLMGMIHSLTGSFIWSGVLLMAIGIGGAYAGWGAGRALQVNVRVEA
ncbi:CynX/NimT family MFS transporter [Paenochrobactrum pullorum]|uniref:CynX/NimT family MFS transporter n=1 Tax=Paenochrobactrum pullorum TaxID=1324351 RepID=UPI0035BBDEA3